MDGTTGWAPRSLWRAGESYRLCCVDVEQASNWSCVCEVTSSGMLWMLSSTSTTSVSLSMVSTLLEYFTPSRGALTFRGLPGVFCCTLYMMTFVSAPSITPPPHNFARY